MCLRVAARTVYDAASRVVKVIKAWAGATDGTGATLDCATMRSDTAGDPSELQQCYQEYAYTANGQIATVKDANGNLTSYEYDEYDRLKKTVFPSKTTAGQSDASDYEEYAYDENANMTAKRARSDATIAFLYDNLNRLRERAVPGAPAIAESCIPLPPKPQAVKLRPEPS